MTDTNNNAALSRAAITLTTSTAISTSKLLQILTKYLSESDNDFFWSILNSGNLFEPKKIFSVSINSHNTLDKDNMAIALDALILASTDIKKWKVANPL